MEKVDLQEESWNKKRIFIAVFLLLLLSIVGYLLKTRILSEKLSQPTKLVEGASSREKSTEPGFKLDIQEAVENKINSIKQEVSGLDVMEIASSSPQVQKILQDIKSLEQYPANQLQEICKKVCGLSSTF